MVVMTTTVEREEAVQTPLITDWPVRSEPDRERFIEPWPVREPSLEDRLRQLTEDPRPFRDWLVSYGNRICGHSYDGTRCPWAMFILHELGAAAALGGVYVNVHRTGLHPCMQRRCERYPHVNHSEWLREFVYAVDAGVKGRGVRGAKALAILDAAIGKTAARSGA
jgi:hypothetical protein